MTLSAGVVSLKQQTLDLAALAATKNPRTMPSEEKAEFYETIKKVYEIVDKDFNALHISRQTEPVNPQEKNGDYKALGELHPFLANLKFPYGRTPLSVTFIETRQIKMILVDNTATILDLRKAAGKAFDVPLEFAEMYVDNQQFPDDKECVEFLMKNSYVRLKLKKFEIPGPTKT